MQNSNYIFGIRAVQEAIKAGKQIDKIFIKNGLKGDLFHDLFSEIKNKNLSFQFVPQIKLDKITKKNHQGIIALVSPIEYTDIEKLVPLVFEEGRNPFFIILDRITDVRNFGAIARTAECAGIDGIIIPEKGSAAINADAIKTSAGALHNIHVCKVKKLSEAIYFLQQSGINIFAVTEKTSSNYYDKDFKQPLALIMGAEDKGISPDILKISNENVKIPLLGKIESLNVSVAAGILIYEVVKQRI